VEAHGVLLPDEYDQIHEELEPFWGIHPLDLRYTEDEPADTFTVGKEASGPIQKLGVSSVDSANPEYRGDQHFGEILHILKDVEHHLPPFRAVFSPHDNPRMFWDRKMKDVLLVAASSGDRESTALCARN
jgi:hypothetical protein